MQRSSTARDTESRWPGQLAAIDMGSNSFRLEIGQLQGGRYRRIDYLKETVRLGAGLDAAGFLDDAAAARGLDCLARFARRCIVEEPGGVESGAEAHRLLEIGRASCRERV